MENSQTVERSIIKGRIKKVTILKNDKVYDITVQKNHNFFANNILVHNCGEIPLAADSGEIEIDGKIIKYAGDICNLGNMNLVTYWNGTEFDWKKFECDATILVRAQDNLIDISTYQFPELEAGALLRRKIGCGLMGLGSLFMMMKMEYGSEESKEFTKKLMDFYVNIAYTASSNIAAEKGSFPLFQKLKEKKGYLENGKLWESTKKLIETNGLRNSALLTIAPNGNTSIYAGIESGGIEPVFETEYNRWVNTTHRAKDELGDKWHEEFMKGNLFETEYFKFSNKGNEEVLLSTDGLYQVDKNRGLTKKVYCEDLGFKYLQDNGIDTKKSPFTKTAKELSITQHLDIMKICSDYVDNSISKTINLIADYPYDEFSGLFIDAWKSGIRGLTTYREGTMSAVLESIKTVKKDEKEIKKEIKNFFKEWERHENEAIVIDTPDIPDEFPMKGFTERYENTKFYVMVSFKDKQMTKPFAMFVKTNNKENLKKIEAFNAVQILEDLIRSKGINGEMLKGHMEKIESCTNNVEKVMRQISMCLRHNIPVLEIINTLQVTEGLTVANFINRIAKFMYRFVDVEKEGLSCPQCGDKSIIMAEGCLTCNSCGFSKC